MVLAALFIADVWWW